MFVGMAQVDFETDKICFQAEDQVLAAGLVSSPGFGVIDSGCGRTLIGKETLEQLETKLRPMTSRRAERYEAISSFRFGNGATEVSNHAVKIPVSIGGVPGIIDAAIIEGRAPLLLGRPTLERLCVSLDFAQKTMQFLNTKLTVPMQVNSAGQLLINILEFPTASRSSPSTTPVLQAEVPDHAECQDNVQRKQTQPEPRTVLQPPP